MPKLNLQKGAALILLVFVLSLVLLAYSVRILNANDVQAAQNIKTFKALSDAKAALISWSVNHPFVPGLMPYPDRNNDPGGYDGLSDCPGGVTIPAHLLGKLPWKSADYNDCNTLISGLGNEFKDGASEPLWYAVSKNLVHIYSPAGDPIINPSIIDNPPYGAWLTIYDKNGQLISDRVAVVIIAPGSPNEDQDRSAAAPNPTEYLDKFYIGAAIKSNTGYSLVDEDFFLGEDSRGVRSDNAYYQQPYYFNDKLIYITIDELMAAVEKRAAGEARVALQKYYSINGYFPYAAALGSITNPNQCITGNLQGLLATTAPATNTCTCTDAASCNCNFAAVSSVSFIRNSSSYGVNGAAAPTGACVVGGASNRTCTCSGNGSCKSTTGATTQFSCDSCGNCTSSIAGNFLFKNANGFSASSGGCAINGTDISCNGTVAGSFALNACTNPVIPTSPIGLPAWFTNNSWQNYIYYAVSSNCTSAGTNCTTASPQLTVGLRTNIRSLVIASGKPIDVLPYAASKSATQMPRPSCEVKDYLDSVQNTTTPLVNGNGALIYDAISTPKTSSYNDQTFIVAP